VARESSFSWTREDPVRQSAAVFKGLVRTLRRLLNAVVRTNVEPPAPTAGATVLTNTAPLIDARAHALRIAHRAAGRIRDEPNQTWRARHQRSLTVTTGLLERLRSLPS
jgi:hypothetical protein